MKKFLIFFILIFSQCAFAQMNYAEIPLLAEESFAPPLPSDGGGATTPGAPENVSIEMYLDALTIIALLLLIFVEPILKLKSVINNRKQIEL